MFLPSLGRLRAPLGVGGGARLGQHGLGDGGAGAGGGDAVAAAGVGLGLGGGRDQGGQEEDDGQLESGFILECFWYFSCHSNTFINLVV